MLDGLFEQHRLVALISRSLCFPDISYCWKSMNQFAKNLHFPGSQDVILLCYAVKLRESLCQYRTRHKKYVACANNNMNCVRFFYHSKVNHACIPNKRLHSDLSKTWPSNHLYLYSKLIKWYDESIFNFRSVNKNIHRMYRVNFNE